LKLKDLKRKAGYGKFSCQDIIPAGSENYV